MESKYLELNIWSTRFGVKYLELYIWSYINQFIEKLQNVAKKQHEEKRSSKNTIDIFLTG